MATLIRVHLAAVCTAWSCSYLARSFEQHALTGRPRLSSILVLFLSGFACLLLSYLSRWTPNVTGLYPDCADGPDQGGILSHTDRDTAPSHSHGTMPDRPRRYFLPLIACCIVLRLEIFHWVSSKQECSTPGVESFICILLFCYEILTTGRRWSFPTPDNTDDPWRSIFDDLYDWFSGPRVKMTLAGVSVLVISVGTNLSFNPPISSSYYCFNLVDSRRSTFFLQLIGLALDAAIIVLTWRTLTWSRTTRAKLHTMGTCLTMSSMAAGLVWLGKSLRTGHEVTSEVGSGPLYGLHILLDSAIFAVFLLSTSVWVCSTSPLLPSVAITAVLGLDACMNQVLAWGDWLHFESREVLTPLWLISGGIIFFLNFYDAKYLFFLRRALLVLLISVTVLGVTIYTFRHRPQAFVKRHPITELMHKSQIAHDQWVKNARISESLPVAIATYEERHPGQSTPPGFSEWYDYAKETAVIDDFEQIDSDLAMFRSLSPEALREGVLAVSGFPHVLTIHVKDGKVTHGPVDEGQAKDDLDDLVNVISKFSQHLPDMILPINLGSSPRILPSWDTVHSGRSGSLFTATGTFFKRSVAAEQNSTNLPLEDRSSHNGEEHPEQESVNPNEYRQMMIDSCSPSARARATPRWSNTQFCAACIRRHSKGSLLTDWEASLKTCAQSDLKYLHSFYLSSPQESPIRELLPLFSLAKTDSFSDILLPLRRLTHGENPDIKWKFSRRYDTMFWKSSIGRGRMNEEYLRGSHKLRLLHNVEDPGRHDKAVLILPEAGRADSFVHEKVPALEANSVAPFVLEIGNLPVCETHECELLREAYGSRQGGSQEPLEYRYVLLLDEDDGPPKELVRTLHSNSVPFVSTIFRSWYTERIQPWLHFVPIDLRYQALHTTYLYFTGTEGRGSLNGRDTKMKGRLGDAEWIAHAGRKWVDKALGDKDVEVYLFRLLLEWGRLIDDQRDEIGLRRSKDGGFITIGFTKS